MGWRNRLRVVVAAAVVGGTLVAPDVGAVAQPGTGQPVAGQTGTELTLVTGDRLRVWSTPGGGRAVSVLPTPGREHIGFLRDGDRVVPSDALPLIDSGRLDPRLFDLGLIPRDKPAPVIVTDLGQSLRAAAPGTGVRALPSVNGAAMTPAAGFWGWFAASTAKVWLDGVAKPTLDVSVPQIGAPAVWQSGYTGAGVTVGLLDTGVDGDHPDLKGKLVDQADFTGTGTADQLGHGTHVAGIIAGTGAASGGRYRGVAPDAKLVSGKVCAAMGCPDSAVIAGLEWIAPKAKVVNLSLGGAYSDGTDPVSRAVNDLTARYGTLFVVAAGNDRALDTPDPFASVTSPAAADSALAVGSVTKQDTTSPFSPRQPRLRDYAVKPDIAAPGSDIVSLRVPGTPAGDTAPVDEHYAALSGTSMAAPHVAGTAALLVQKQPTWTVEQLKPTLVSTAKPTADPFEQGAGRVDAARAASQRVTALGGGLGFGYLPWPHNTRLAKTVTYRNDGAQPVTLRLATDSPLFTPSAPQVVVPAHGTAQAGVTLDPTGKSGRQSGRLTATADGVVVQTALTSVLQEQTVGLTVNVKGRTGKTASVVAKAVNADTGAAMGVRVVNGVGTARLPAGRYDVEALEVSDTNDVTLLARPGVTVDRDTAVTLDATAGKPVTTAVDGTATTFTTGELTLASGTASGDRVSSLGWFSQPDQHIYLAPTAGKVTDHTFAFAYRATLAGPQNSVYHLVFTRVGAIPDGRFTAKPGDLARVDARYYAQGAPTQALRADYATVPLPGLNSGAFFTHQLPIPRARTEYYSAGPDVHWQHLTGMYAADTSDAETSVSLRTHKPGRESTHWFRAPVGPAVGDPSGGFGVQRVDGVLNVLVGPLSGGDPDQFTVLPAAATGSTTLSRDGAVLGTSEVPGAGSFPIPDTAGVYTLRTVLDRTVPWSLLGTHADVSWTFTEGGASATTPPPLLEVRATGDVDDQGRAPRGPFPLLLTAQHQAGAPNARVTSTRVEYSTDDGATWLPAVTIHSGSGGIAVVCNGNKPGFTSLRITAKDADGNSVTQTVIRALQVK
ncbi:S8 family peptidase [Actinokineospora enzanensis]|uniref:S8 family peptidase n=1 Tax=Actinokineospora enzanensis TaxID=155975 RepID=UPI00036AD6D7|nr:S8 family serine peptidase [Actinokineospora enzanensis]